MDNTTLRILAEDAIDNIDYPGSDSELWTSKAKNHVKALAAALEAAEAELTRRDTVIGEAHRVVDEFLDGTSEGVGPLAHVAENAIAAIHEVLAAAPVSLEAVKAETTTEWNAVRQDATGELWDVYEPFDSREDAERVASEWRGNNEPDDDPVVVVERTKGVAPGEWRIVAAEANDG